jgi:hypothetical protein
MAMTRYSEIGRNGTDTWLVDLVDLLGHEPDASVWYCVL